MPYTVRARDGTEIYGIPDDIAKDDPRIRRHVEWARSSESGPEKRHPWPVFRFKDIPGGIVSGAANLARNLEHMIGTVPTEELQQASQLEARQPQSMGRDIGRFAGETGMGGIAGGAAGGMLGGVASRMAPGIVSRVPPAVQTGLRGATEGAIEGAALAGPEQRLSGALTGAGAAGGLGLAGGTAAQGFRTPDAAARTLLDMGVDLTPGQMKPGGTMSMLEQVAESVPVAGPFITGARERAKQQFAVSMVNEALPPGAAKVKPSNINSMSDEAYRAFEPAYNEFKGYPVYKGWDEPLEDSFQRITKDPDFFASDEERKQVSAWLGQQLTRLRNTETVDSGDLLALRSKIRERSRRLRVGAQPKDEVSEMLNAADAAVTKVIGDQVFVEMPGDALPALAAVDRQYAKYKIIEEAAAKTKRGTTPTPNQWAMAAQKQATSRQKAHGKYLFAPQTQAAMEVFETTVPRTGARMATLGTLGIGGMGGYYDPLMTGAVFGPAALLAGTRTGRRLSTGDLPLQRAIKAGMAGAPQTSGVLGAMGRAAGPAWIYRDQ